MSEDSAEVSKVGGGLTADQLKRSRALINGLGVNKTRIQDPDTNKQIWPMKSSESPVSIKSKKIQNNEEEAA